MLQAIKARIIVKPEELRQENVSSGLYVVGDLTQLQNGDMRKGEVISVGSQAEDVKAGDKIYYHKLSGQPFEYEGESYILMYYTEVLGTYV